VVPTANVRGALAAVVWGDVEAAIVYKTDAAISKKVKIAFEVPRADGPKISYPMAVLKDAPEPSAAKRFLQYLNSPAAGKVFAQFGFIVLDAAP
jgi:molybdate transport system substrate-binding protein